MKEEIEQITTENKNKMETIKKQFEQMIEKNNKIVNHNKIKQVDKIIHSTINSSQLKELDEETRKNYIKDIIETYKEVSNENNKFDQKILCIHNLFESLRNKNKDVKSINESNNNDFDSEINFILRNIENPYLTFEQIEILRLNNSLKSIIKDMIQYIDDFTIENDYPSDSYDQISKTYNEIKESYPKLPNKINVVSKIFHQNDNQGSSSIKSKENHYLTIKMNYQAMDKNYFSNVVKALSRKLSGNVTTIKNLDFGYCLMLTQITIPSSTNFNWRLCFQLLFISHTNYDSFICNFNWK